MAHTDDEPRAKDEGTRADARRSPALRRKAAAILAALVLMALVTTGATAQSARALTRHEAFAQGRGDEPAVSAEPSAAVSAEPSAAVSAEPSAAASATPSAPSSTPTPPLDWNAPTGGAYPDVSGAADLWIDVDLAAQRVRIKDGSTTLYTMVCSSGMDDSTPRGTFSIGVRGDFFYNRSEGMGARWWVGFKGTTYLFHTVPTDLYGNYIESEAEKLGEPASHGCVRLSVADSKWIYDTIPEGTRVVIA